MNTVYENKVEEQPLKFGRYVVVRLLGKGAMGGVFLADDPVLERKIALKVITMDPALDKNTLNEYFARFHSEAKASAQLNHPSIVPVYDAGEEKGVPWIAFQYVDGETLDNMLKRREKLPIKRAAVFALDIAAALAHAHSWNIIHRDIKPANILIESSTGIAKLSDFGIAKAPWVATTREGNTIGSPGYMSPEQIQGAELDERVDLFCLGVVLYQMITGQHPFLRDNVANTLLATCNGTFTPLRTIISDMPPAMERAIRRCLAADRRKRISSAAELFDLLKPLAPPDERTTQQVPKKASSLAATAQASVTKTAVTKKERIGSQSLQHRTRQWLIAIGQSFGRFWLRIYSPVSIRSAKTLSLISGCFRPINGNAHGSAIRKLSSDITSKLHSVNRSVVSAVLFWGSLAGIIAATFIFIVYAATNNHTRPPGDSKEAQLVQQCEIGLKENDRKSSVEAARTLIGMNSVFPHTRILIARILIRDGKYESALKILLQAKTLKNGEHTLKKELPDVLDEIARQLRKGAAPIEFLDMTAYTLSAATHPVVRSWLCDTSFWLRWNTVDIFKLSNMDVDMVPIYIQDLSCPENVQTRIQAVRRLGEIGDKRAKSALEKARELGKNDPLVSAEADKILAEKFW